MNYQLSYRLIDLIRAHVFAKEWNKKAKEWTQFRGLTALLWCLQVLKRAQIRQEIVKSCNQRHNLFTNRKVNVLNKLPNEMIGYRTVDEFKGLGLII